MIIGHGQIFRLDKPLFCASLRIGEHAVLVTNGHSVTIKGQLEIMDGGVILVGDPYVWYSPVADKLFIFERFGGEYFLPRSERLGRYEQDSNPIVSDWLALKQKLGEATNYIIDRKRN